MEIDDDVWEEALYEGVTVQFDLGARGPTWGDLEELCGDQASPGCARSGQFELRTLVSLGFRRVDDYLGIRNEGDEGDEVIVWLHPVVNDVEVYHHGGPFDAIRLRYSVLRNPAEHAEIFFNAVARLTDAFGVPAWHRLRGTSLGEPANLDVVKRDVDAIVEHWRSEGTEPGSDEALTIDY